MDTLEQKLYKKAISLLARREHSIEELRSKLLQAARAFARVRARTFEAEGFDAEHQQQECGEDIDSTIGAIIKRLLDNGYLSESRYVEMVVRSRFGKGHGPLKVKAELEQKGVARELVQSKLAAFEGDWFELAAQTRARRFGDPPEDFKEKGKQIRFLASRGFSQEQIAHALDD